MAQPLLNSSGNRAALPRLLPLAAVTMPWGMACIIATGQDWQEVPVEMAGLES